RTWTVSDCAGNTSTGVQTITIYDETPPVIAPLDDGYVCNGEVPEYLETTWTDNCEDGDTLRAYANMVGSDECSETYEYVFNVSDCAGNAADAVTVEYIREFDKIDNCETVFGYRQESDCFLDNGFSRWGWTTQIMDEGEYIFDLYAGNGNDCDPIDGPGTFAGTATLNYDGSTATVVYNMNDGYVLSEAHVYIGCTMFPQGKKGNTVAPGQYNFNPSLGGTVDTYTVGPIDVTGDFWIIIHGVSCEIACECSGGYTYTGNDGGGAFNGDSVNGCDEVQARVAKTVDFKAYPVPFESEVTLQYSFDYETDVKVDVFDMKGALIKSSEDSNYIKDSIGTTTLDLSGTDNQLFFVRLTTKEGTVVKKIVSSTPQ
ncbi:T9SS type A sorting domain-containing protein, partial [Flavisericum labens]|uniref:T9SS type A sorting domain-containing protein n=1 Tax=Flavisericum labens TaxID=3377112 RepID=UPI00387ABC4A